MKDYVTGVHCCVCYILLILPADIICRIWPRRKGPDLQFCIFVAALSVLFNTCLLVFQVTTHLYILAIQRLGPVEYTGIWNVVMVGYHLHKGV